MKWNFFLCLSLILGMSAAVLLPADASGADHSEKKKSKTPSAGYHVEMKDFQKSGNKRTGISYKGSIDVSSLAPGKYYIWLYGKSKKPDPFYVTVNSGEIKSVTVVEEKASQIGTVDIKNGLQITITASIGANPKLKYLVLTANPPPPKEKDIKKLLKLKVIE